MPHLALSERNSDLNCTGAILAGGLSTRMGQPKHSMEMPDGRTMIEHVAGALKSVCERLVVVTAQHSPRLKHVPGLELVTDLRQACGPLGGIEALLASGIASRPEGLGQYLICPCDVPLVTPELLELLLSPSDALATVFHGKGRDEIEPLPARIRADVLPVVRRLLNSRVQSIWRLMNELQPDIVTMSTQQATQLHNVNTESEFRDAIRLLT